MKSALTTLLACHNDECEEVIAFDYDSDQLHSALGVVTVACVTSVEPADGVSVCDQVGGPVSAGIGTVATPSRERFEGTGLSPDLFGHRRAEGAYNPQLTRRGLK